MFDQLKILFVLLVCVQCSFADSVKHQFEKKIKPFFKTYCIDCHGLKKSKGKITLHTFDYDIASGHGIEHWEEVLDALRDGEMPPEEEEQPKESERLAVAQWIDQGIREYVKNESAKETEPTTRRLTNFEYENTMRDLLGFRLNLIDNLPVDPIKPYKFNNTAKFMLMGMEQLDRYKENARRAMASAIVDPAKPKIHKTKRTWASRGGRPSAKQFDELGGGRGAPGGGMGLTSFPETGEFSVKIKASGIFPNNISEIPMRLVMGYDLGHNSSTLQVEPIGVASVSTNCDNPEFFEFRGRIENFPKEPVKNKHSGKIEMKLSIRPQNIYNDGRLNDYINAFKRPRLVVNSLEFEAPVFKTWPPKHHMDILFDSPLRKDNPKAYVREVIKRFMTRAFRRPVKKKEVDVYTKMFGIISEDIKELEGAMRETLAMVLISPDFLYHTVSEGKGEYEQYEEASKLSYFLWGSMPDKELFDLAKEGKLNDSNVIKQQVTRMLNDNKAHDFVKNFTVQWLSIEKMKQVAINKSVFPRFLHTIKRGERTGLEVPYVPTVRDYMMDETIGFVYELIKQNMGVENVIDSNFAMLNQRLAYHYGVKGVEGHKLRPVSINSQHNIGGLLTHASVLIGNSNGTAPHPIYRAVWLREAILGDEVKDHPAEVPALVDTAGESAEKALSIKELLVKHRQVESCNDCHVRLDPWGVPFEHYNAVGRYRPMVPKEGVRVRPMKNNMYQELETYEAYQKYLNSVNTEKVDAEARVPHGPKVKGMADLKKHIIKDRLDDVAKNMIKRLMTYAIGRELSYRDRYAIEKLLKQSKGQSYKLKDMIISICQSSTFKGN